MDGVWQAVWLTLQVATVATAVVFVPGSMLAYVLARYPVPGKSLISALVGLPLVLPPTAVGYLLLQALGAGGLFGDHGIQVLLTWQAAVLAAVVMSAPLVIRTARVSFEAVDPELEQMARTLGLHPVEVFVYYTIPLAGRGLLAAALLGFTRAVGEFGATVTIAGNIPGRTQTLAAAIFSAQQVGDEQAANMLLLVALSLGVVSIIGAEYLARERR